VRQHEGQDVFCDYGAPVLASEVGIVEFGTDVLGGRVARLFRPDGSHWYYAAGLSALLVCSGLGKRSGRARQRPRRTVRSSGADKKVAVALDG
jgi:hypothetical protein